LAGWKTPLTMMLGTESSILLKEATTFLSQSIPGCRVVMLEGQGHGAMLEAPELFLAKVLEIAAPEIGHQTA
jgi:pimeloyl-ACP methyl ester carboxylesterase